MKVRYTLPARGVLRISDAQPIVLHDWHFFFQVNEHTQFVDRIIVEIQNVPEENWPTLRTVEQNPDAKIPRFPFAVNENALKYKDIHDKIVALESILSVFGLWAIDYSTMQEEWISQEGDEEASIFAGWKLESKVDLDNIAPVNNELLARCIIAAGRCATDFISTAHFRLGREHFENRRYLEAIRHLFFVLEYEYGQGVSGKRKLIKNFESSAELRQVLVDEINRDSNFILKRVSKKFKNDKQKIDEKTVIEYIISLRGTIQHANGYTNKKWHPSRDKDFQLDAVFLMNVVSAICHDRVNKAMWNVPVGRE